MSYDPPIPMASIKPEFVAIYYESANPGAGTGILDMKNKRPISNIPGRTLSEKAKKRLKTCVGWMYQLAKRKEVYNNRLNKRYTFKVNFITLTLPAIQRHTDSTIKTKCLNQFLTEMRTHHAVNNYIWRAEAQDNGNLHFHIMTDTYIDWYVIRRTWNRIIGKLGYIDRYHARFKGLSFDQYKAIREQNGKKSLTDLVKAYDYGEKSNWKDPNTTDVHKLHNKKSIAAYISKYMTKDPGSSEKSSTYSVKERKIPGRKWGVSQKLGKIKSIREQAHGKIEEVCRYAKEELKVHVIEDVYFSVFCIKISQWKRKFFEYYSKLMRELITDIGYIAGGISPKMLFFKYQ